MEGHGPYMVGHLPPWPWASLPQKAFLTTPMLQPVGCYLGGLHLCLQPCRRLWLVEEPSRPSGWRPSLVPATSLRRLQGGEGCDEAGEPGAAAVVCQYRSLHPHAAATASRLVPAWPAAGYWSPRCLQFPLTLPAACAGWPGLMPCCCCFATC